MLALALSEYTFHLRCCSLIQIILFLHRIPFHFCRPYSCSISMVLCTDCLPSSLCWVHFGVGTTSACCCILTYYSYGKQRPAVMFLIQVRQYVHSEAGVESAAYPPRTVYMRCVIPLQRLEGLFNEGNAEAIDSTWCMAFLLPFLKKGSLMRERTGEIACLSMN